MTRPAGEALQGEERLETPLALAAASGHAPGIRLERPRGARAGKSSLRRD